MAPHHRWNAETKRSELCPGASIPWRTHLPYVKGRHLKHPTPRAMYEEDARCLVIARKRFERGLKGKKT